MTDTNVEKYEFEPIKGYPMLNWKGKRPYRITEFYPSQLKEVYGAVDESGWINKILWGDNLQVMSHLLKGFRGKIDLVYIDPPFDSKADYKKKIKVKGKKHEGDISSFEEKQYSDIWNNDEYLQFMYQRLILLRELLSDRGTLYLHCDWHKSHQLRCILDEVFGESNFLNEVIWYYRRWNIESSNYSGNHDNILVYCKKKGSHIFNQLYIPKSSKSSGQGKSWVSIIGDDGVRRSVLTDEVSKGVPMPDVWNQDTVDYYQSGADFWEISMINPVGNERVGYPTQKPESLLERIIKASSEEGSIVFDCFMGSGTTASVAQRLGRKFIGADINLGAVQTTTKRLLKLDSYFEVHTVNNYDVFRNPSEAKSLLLEALEVQALDKANIYDGEKDGFKVKVMPVNRIATKEDLNELISNFPYKIFEKRKAENPNKPVEDIMLVCMGHEPGLGATLENESGYKLNVQVVDILRDKSDLTFKYDSEASIQSSDGKIIIEEFYPRNLLQKLSQQKEDVTEWREMVESIMIDWNYDGAVMEPTVIDIPEKNEFVKGEYEIPDDATNIKIKITDLLSESYEEVISNA